MNATHAERVTKRTENQNPIIDESPAFIAGLFLFLTFNPDAAYEFVFKLVFIRSTCIVFRQ